MKKKEERKKQLEGFHVLAIRLPMFQLRQRTMHGKK
jgi:hypothetical protein